MVTVRLLSVCTRVNRFASFTPIKKWHMGANAFWHSKIKLLIAFVYFQRFDLMVHLKITFHGLRVHFTVPGRRLNNIPLQHAFSFCPFYLHVPLSLILLIWRLSLGVESLPLQRNVRVLLGNWRFPQKCKNVLYTVFATWNKSWKYSNRFLLFIVLMSCWINRISNSTFSIKNLFFLFLRFS